MTAPESGNTSEEPLYHQPPLEGMELFPETEIELGNCTITSPVTYKKRAKGNLWQCHVHAAPDLLHPDQEGDFEVIANGAAADMAQRAHLRPGGRAVIRGSLHEQTVLLESGEELTMTRVAVSAIEVISRVPRKSITLYEQQQMKENGTH